MNKTRLVSISFLQASGLATYIALVTTFIRNVESWLGRINSPLIPLSLLVFSALVCALIAFAYPIFLIWDKKQTKNGILIVIYTTAWLFLFLVALIALFAST